MSRFDLEGGRRSLPFIDVGLCHGSDRHEVDRLRFAFCRLITGLHDLHVEVLPFEGEFRGGRSERFLEAVAGNLLGLLVVNLGGIPRFLRALVQPYCALLREKPPERSSMTAILDWQDRVVDADQERCHGETEDCEIGPEERQGPGTRTSPEKPGTSFQASLCHPCESCPAPSSIGAWSARASRHDVLRGRRHDSMATLPRTWSTLWKIAALRACGGPGSTQRLRSHGKGLFQPRIPQDRHDRQAQRRGFSEFLKGVA